MLCDGRHVLGCCEDRETDTTNDWDDMLASPGHMMMMESSDGT
jgi:hypothetical protein